MIGKLVILAVAAAGLLVPPTGQLAPTAPSKAGASKRAGLFEHAPAAHLLHNGDRFAPGRLQDKGNGIAYVGRPIGAATVSDIDVNGVYRVVETGVGAAGRLTIRDIHATNVQRGLARIRGDLSGMIRDCDVTFASKPQVPPNLPAGIAFDGTAHDWLIENVTIRGAQMRMPPERYWNGDGISSELGNRGLTFRHVAVFDSTDAGFDLKGSDTTLDNTIASGNARNYRLWQSMRLGTITSVEPTVRGGRTSPAHIWVTGKFAPTIRIKRLVVRATASHAAVIRVEDGPANIIIESADIKVPLGTPLVVGAQAKVTWLSGTPRI